MSLQLRAGAHGEPTPRAIEGLEYARAGLDELRELGPRHPPGDPDQPRPAAAVEALADRAPLPVEVDVPEERYPPSVESAAYFVAAEALTNVAKYARGARSA